MDCLAFSFYLCASEFVVVLGKFYWLISSENIHAYGMWLASPDKKPQDGLSSHSRNIPRNTNNWHFMAFLLATVTNKGCLA